ncbi:MAG: type II and III secretion system protein family protein [Thiohalocapsa sp.]
MIRRFLTGAAASLMVLTMAAQAAEPISPASPAGPGGPPGAATAMPVKASGGVAVGDPAVASGTVSQVRAKGPPIVLEAGKGSLIRLPRPAATVFIANPDVADVQIKSPLLIYVSAKTPGETVLYAVDAQDQVMLNAPVRVEHDLSRFRQGLGAVAPGENVSVTSVDNSLILNGRVSSPARAEKVRSLAASIASETKATVVNRMSVATPNQVSIRVKVVEINRQALKSLGVNWSKAGGHVKFNTTLPIAAGATPATTELGILFGGASWLTSTTVDALAQEGLVSILAEPNLTATNGQPASFLAGGEFPVPVVQSGTGAGGTTGSTALTVEFKQFGVSLDCTPTIIDAEHLNLRIRAQASQLSTSGEVVVSGFTIPALTTRRAETMVELGSGQSFILGGLLQNTDTLDVSKVPWLGDIPVLGQLFRSEQFQRNETELVFIVTPYLVNPIPQLAKIATPIDGFTPPHDVERIIGSGLYRQKLPAPAKGPLGPAGTGLIGPVGFRLD